MGGRGAGSEARGERGACLRPREDRTSSSWRDKASIVIECHPLSGWHSRSTPQCQGEPALERKNLISFQASQSGSRAAFTRSLSM